MLNSLLMTQRANALAKALQNLPSNEQRIRNAYLRLYARPVTEQELQLALAFLEDASRSDQVWAQYAQVLLSAHEFLQIR